MTYILNNSRQISKEWLEFAFASLYFAAATKWNSPKEQNCTQTVTWKNLNERTAFSFCAMMRLKWKYYPGGDDSRQDVQIIVGKSVPYSVPQGLALENNKGEWNV